MKKIGQYCCAFLLAFICSNLFTLKVHAQYNNVYKTTTNRSIIYIVENDGSLSHSWQFDREKYKDNINFSLNLLNKSPYENEINKNINDNIKLKYLSFEHHGSLPATALMKVKVSDKFVDGDKLYLYYYNEKLDRLEYINNELTVKNGFAEFKIDHCSDYILTASIVKTAFDNPQSMTVVIMALLGLGVILVAVTLFVNGKR